MVQRKSACTSRNARLRRDRPACSTGMMWFWAVAGLPGIPDALFQPGWDFLPFPNLLERLPFTDEGGLVSMHQHFRRLRAGVVIGGHYKPIGARAQERQMFAFCHLRQRTILAEVIARLANRPNDIRGDESFAGRRAVLLH